MASVRTRSDGRLFFDFQYQGVRCRELTALQDAPANRRKVQRVLDGIVAEIANGTFEYARYFPGSKQALKFMPTTKPARLPAGMVRSDNREPRSTAPTFQAFTVEWIRAKQVEWRLSHRASVESALNSHLFPAFGDRAVDEITREDVLDFRADLASKHVRMPGKTVETGKKLSPATVNKVVGILRMILDEAALRFDFSNPCISIKRLKVPRKDIEPFDLDEVQTILANVRPDYRPYLAFRFFTGVRSSEANGLKWACVDFERRQILIRETFQAGRTEGTKTSGSRRDIEMNDPVFKALMTMRPALFERDPKAFADHYVFHTRNGLPIDNTNFNDRVWKPLLRRLGYRYRRPYQMRHTCATLWLAAGESPEWIARQLGHTTTEMLFRTYSRYVPNLVRRDGIAFNRMITGALHGGVTLADPVKDAL